jgi:hypothetical protein
MEQLYGGLDCMKISHKNEDRGLVTNQILTSQTY